VIKLPLNLQNISLSKYMKEKQDWNYNLINNSQHLISHSKQHTQCYWIKTDNDQDLNSLVGYPDLKQIYKPLKNQCILSANFYYFHNGVDDGMRIRFLLFWIPFAILTVLCIVILIMKLSKWRSNGSYVSAYYQLTK